MDGELFDGQQEAIDAVRNYYKQQNIIVYESWMNMLYDPFFNLTYIFRTDVLRRIFFRGAR